MRKLAVLSLILLTSCYVNKTRYSSKSTSATNKTKRAHKSFALGNIYQYSFELVKPEKSIDFSYEDTTAKFHFTVSEKEIDFSLTNKSEKAIKVVWDEASLVQFGAAQKIIHKDVKYVDRSNSMPPTSVPPASTLFDMALPAENISYREGYYGTVISVQGGWETNDLFPRYDLNKKEFGDKILATKGSEFTLFLPVKTSDDKELDYSFTFRISDVVCTTCREEKQKTKSL